MSTPSGRGLRNAVLGVITGLLCLSMCAPAAAYIYVNPQGQSLEAAGLDGTGLTFVNGRPTPSGGLASDGTYLYLGYHVLGSDPPQGIDRVKPDGSGFTAGFVHLPTPTCTNDPAAAASADAIAVDGAHIYWADRLMGTIGRADLINGGAVNPQFIQPAAGECGALGAVGGTGPAGLAVDAGHIYWTNPAQNSIGRANLDGGAPTQSFITGAVTPWAVAVSGPNIYWTNTTTASEGPGSIGHAQLDASGALIPGSVNESFITGLTAAAAVPLELAVQGGSLFFDNGDGWIGKASADGTNVVHHLLKAYEDSDSAPPGLAVDAGQAAPTRATIACNPSSLQVLDPIPNADVGVPVGNLTACRLIVRDTGPSPGPVAGTVLFSEAPIAGGFVSADTGDLVPRGRCTLKPASAPGVSFCGFEYAAASNVPGFVRHAPHTTLTAAYAGELTHSSTTGSVAIPLSTVHACAPAQLCNSLGQLASGTSKPGPHGTLVTTYVLFGGKLTVTTPSRCTAAGRRLSIKLAFTHAKGDKLFLRRVRFTLSGRRSQATRAPFAARLTVPRGRPHAALTLTVRLDFGDPQRVDTITTIKLGVAAC